MLCCVGAITVQETYGEDPYLSAEMATAYVHGLQGNDARYVRASAGCKHFAVYAGPENVPTSRMSFDVKVCIINVNNYKYSLNIVTFNPRTSHPSHL